MDDDTIPWIGPVRLRPEACTIANGPPVDEYGNDGTVVVITFVELNCPLDIPETIVAVPLPVDVEPLLNALEDIEKTGVLTALVVVIVVDVNEEALCTKAIAPEPEVVTGWLDAAGEAVTRS